MKRIIAFMCLVMAVALPAFAEKEESGEQPVDYYIEVVGTQRGLNPGMTIKVNTGRLLPSLIGLREQELSSAMRTMQFNNMVDALNYFSQRGWRVATNYTCSSAGSNTVSIVLCKTTADTSEILSTFIK